MIKERIDRAIANGEWTEFFPNTLVEHLKPKESYHSSIILRIEKKKFLANRPFRFLEAWTSDDSSIPVVKIAWDGVTQYGMANHVIRKCLFSTSQAFNKWNNEVFGIAQIRIKELEE